LADFFSLLFRLIVNQSDDLTLTKKCLNKFRIERNWYDKMPAISYSDNLTLH